MPIHNKMDTSSWAWKINKKQGHNDAHFGSVKRPFYPYVIIKVGIKLEMPVKGKIKLASKSKVLVKYPKF